MLTIALASGTGNPSPAKFSVASQRFVYPFTQHGPFGASGTETTYSAAGSATGFYSAVTVGGATVTYIAT